MITLAGASVLLLLSDLAGAAQPLPVAPGAGTVLAGVAAGPQGDTWSSIARLPDLTTGVWLLKMPAQPAGGSAPGPQEPPTAAARDGRDCSPNSMPGIMSGPMGMEFLLTPGKVTINIEVDRAVRRVLLRPRHSADPDYGFMGESIAHWERDVLVIDTIAIKSAKRPAPSHIIERMKLLDPDTLQIEQTIFDGSDRSTRINRYERRRGERIMEYYCEENPRDGYDATGHAFTDTTQK